MNATSLHALVIDRHFGELAPEVSELLGEHLARDPAAKDEADRILRALSTTELAVIGHPELARVGVGASSGSENGSVVAPATSSKKRTSIAGWLARAAIFLVLLGSSGAAGFFMGRTAPVSPSQPSITLASAGSSSQKPRPDSPWANYRLTNDAGSGGLRLVRVDTLAIKKSSLR